MKLRFLNFFICFLLFTFIFSGKVSADTLKLDEEESKLQYNVTCFGITFKKKLLPVTGEIIVAKPPPQVPGFCELPRFLGINMKARFTSVNPLFRKFINFDLYPDFDFQGILNNPINLRETKEIELEGYLSFHGVTNKIKIMLKNKSKDNLIKLTGTLLTKMSDYGLEPPHFVFLTIDDIIKTKIELVAPLLKE